jgi:membrane associated rhomboid family serine protease
VSRLILLGIVAGIVTALASVAVLRLIGAEVSPAVVGGISGAVAGGMVAILLRTKAK